MSRSNGDGVTKLSRSVYLDKPVVEEANAKNINLSALANDLLGEYFRTDSSARARLEAKREHLLERREHHQGQLDQIEDELEEVKRQLEHFRVDWEKQRDRLADLAECLPVTLDTDNLAIQNQAPQFDMTPAELVDAIENIREEENITGVR